MIDYLKDAVGAEVLHGDTVVAVVTIKMRRSGLMSVEGSITDEVFARHMLDTARDVITNYHIQQKLGNRSPIIVAADDTSLVGTPAEKRLLAARDELDNALVGG